MSLTFGQVRSVTSTLPVNNRLVAQLLRADKKLQKIKQSSVSEKLNVESLACETTKKVGATQASMLMSCKVGEMEVDSPTLTTRMATEGGMKGNGPSPGSLVDIYRTSLKASAPIQSLDTTRVPKKIRTNGTSGTAENLLTANNNETQMSGDENRVDANARSLVGAMTSSQSEAQRQNAWHASKNSTGWGDAADLASAWAEVVKTPDLLWGCKNRDENDFASLSSLVYAESTSDCILRGEKDPSGAPLSAEAEDASTTAEAHATRVAPQAPAPIAPLRSALRSTGWGRGLQAVQPAWKTRKPSEGSAVLDPALTDRPSRREGSTGIQGTSPDQDVEVGHRFSGPVASDQTRYGDYRNDEWDARQCGEEGLDRQNRALYPAVTCPSRCASEKYRDRTREEGPPRERYRVKYRSTSPVEYDAIKDRATRGGSRSLSADSYGVKPHGRDQWYQPSSRQWLNMGRSGHGRDDLIIEARGDGRGRGTSRVSTSNRESRTGLESQQGSFDDRGNVARMRYAELGRSPAPKPKSRYSK